MNLKYRVGKLERIVDPDRIRGFILVYKNPDGTITYSDPTNKCVGTKPDGQTEEAFLEQIHRERYNMIIIQVPKGATQKDHDHS
jgi:hypothetical protein